MRHESVSKKCGDAALRAIHKLIRREKFARAKIFFERPDCAYGNDSLDAKQLHSIDVGAVVDLSGQNAMPTCMASQKCNLLPFQRAKNNGVRWVAKRRLDSKFVCVRKTLHRVKPAAADYPNLRLQLIAGFFPAARLLC